MQILMLNQDWFKNELEAMGHKVITCGIADHLDVRLPFPLLQYSEVCTLCNMRPDAVIFHDNSVPIFLTALETVAVPMIAYTVDVQHHIRQQRHYTRFFNAVFCAQKDFLTNFEAGGCGAQWLPLWAPRLVEPSLEKRHKAVFVGTMDPTLNPDRVKFFEALAKKIPLECLRGEYWNIFPYSEVVMNQTVKGDLNFRVFEAMMCGTTLVTEMSGNGLNDLFTPNVHLATYTRGDVDDAAGVVNDLLLNAGLRQEIAREGRRLVIERHDAKARAAVVADSLNIISASSGTKRSAFSLVPNYAALGLYYRPQSESLAMSAFQESMRLAELAVSRKEPLEIEIAKDIVAVCTFVDSKTSSPRAGRLLDSMRVQYPDIVGALC